MASRDSEAPSVTVNLSEVETKVLEWALQFYRETEQKNPDIDDLATQLRGLAVGFNARRNSGRTGKSE